MAIVTLHHNEPTERMKYGAKLLFNVCLGLDVEWDLSNSILRDSYEITTSISSSRLVLFPIHCLSTNNDALAISDGIEWSEWNGKRYPCKTQGIEGINFDPLAAAFYCASRWEEVNGIGDFDKHGRFMGKSSSAYKQGMLRTPLIENLSVALAKMLDIPIKNDTYKFLPTIDIDVAFAYLGRPWYHTYGAICKDLLRCRFNTLRERIKVLFSNKIDPYDTYEWIESLHSSYKLRTQSFMLCADFNPPFDIGLQREGGGLRKCYDDLSEKWNVCWHPGYKAISNSEFFLEEKLKFFGPTDKVRAHFLRGVIPEIWGTYISNEVSHDYSMGYADEPGFRSGMSRPFPAFNAISNEILPLTIHPIALMDSTLLSYLKCNPQEAVLIAQELSDNVKEVGGTMVTLWHNTSVSNHGIWEGWQFVYEEVVKRCIP